MMDGREQILREYARANGRVPFREWLRALKDRRVRAAIRVRMTRLRLGNFGDVKPVGSGVYELRISVGPGYRVYFGRRSQVIVVLLCGGDKKRQNRDIRRAIEYWKDHKRRS